MKNNLSIRAKLVLGMGILVVGYIASAAVGFFSGAARERELAAVATISVPASLKCQSVLFAFESAAKAFTDAVMTGEADTLKTAAANNALATAALDEIARSSAAAGLPGSEIATIRSQLGALDGQRADVFKGMSGDTAARETTRARAEALTANTEKLRQQLTKLAASANRVLDEHLVATTDSTRRQRMTNLFTAGFIVLVGGTVVFLIIQKSIVRPISHVAEGLHESAGLIETASNTIRESGKQLADGASSQAASLEETSATIEEISSVAKRNAEHSETAKDKVSSARAVADRSTEDVGVMRTAMGEIKTASNNIAKIVKAINEIAFQTNLLALNAAVEAARAGEAGAGFAVVADEVRSLAQRSAQAARETADLVEDSIVKSERGVQVSAKVASGLETIGQQIREIDTLVAEIALASQEQSKGVNEVNHAIVRLNETTQSTAASAEESASTGEELAAQVAALNRFTNELASTVHGQSGATSAPVQTATIHAFRTSTSHPVAYKARAV